MKTVCKLIDEEYEWEVLKHLKSSLLKENVYFYRERYCQEVAIIFDVDKAFTSIEKLEEISLQVFQILRERYLRDKRNGTLNLYFC